MVAIEPFFLAAFWFGSNFFLFYISIQANQSSSHTRLEDPSHSHMLEHRNYKNICQKNGIQAKTVLIQII